MLKLVTTKLMAIHAGHHQVIAARLKTGAGLHILAPFFFTVGCMRHQGSVSSYVFVRFSFVSLPELVFLTFKSFQNLLFSNPLVN